MDLATKLSILADAAKYDASCASSGTTKRDSRGGGIGSTTGNGICHAYTPDGRCVSLLKILLTNWCVYDCAYCVSRSSSNVPRAAFTVDEVVRLTLTFCPFPDACASVPGAAPPLRRENRLYLADWLLRFYGFSVGEILAGGEGGMLDLSLDPKLAWALKHRERFPVDPGR